MVFGVWGRPPPNEKDRRHTQVTQATQDPTLWSKIRLLNRFFAHVFPGLVFCSVSMQRPATPMLPHSHPQSPRGPSAIVTGGTHKFWVARGGVLATPLKQQRIPMCKMVGGEPIHGHAYAVWHRPLCFNARALHGPMPWVGERLVVVAYSGAVTANLAPVNLWLLQVLGFPCV